MNPDGDRKPGPADDELSAGQVVDDLYRVVRLIGRGGMGAVYESEDVRLERPVALKVLRSDVGRQLQADQRFVQEARLIAQIRSPHVATVYSVGTAPTGKTYIAMEYVEGESLGDLLDRERWLPLPRALRIVRRVAEALVEAHDRGIIHRDLKPDNILLTRIGSQEDFAKVVDFGLAKILESAGATTNAKLTQTRLVLGTPAYMSPEQAAGLDVGPESDLYSLSVIFYELITGFLPVDGEDPQSFLRAHQVQKPVPIGQRRPDLTFAPSVQAHFDRALIKKPQERFASAREFITALDELESSLANLKLRQSAPIPQRNWADVKNTTQPAIDALSERIERIKERPHLEILGIVSQSRSTLYQALDQIAAETNARTDQPVLIRVRVPRPGLRLPLACFFDEVRARAGVFDDDAAALARRKLLAWCQSVMPDQTARATQIAHLVGLFLQIEFPDSPHLTHAQTVPEVARLAGSTALSELLRALVGRTTLVLVIERVDHLSLTERRFVARLTRQLSGKSTVIVSGWVSPHDDPPPGLGEVISSQAIQRVDGGTPPNLDDLRDPTLRQLLAAATRIGDPIWPDLIAAATGIAIDQPLARLVAIGALRPLPTSRLSNQVEYVLGDVPTEIETSLASVAISVQRALQWIETRATPRPGVWAGRMGRALALVGDTLAAASRMRQAGEGARGVGALPEAVECFERARNLCLSARERLATRDGVVTLAETALPLTQGLLDMGRAEEAASRAAEGLESLRRLNGLTEEDWRKAGVPLLAAWADAEVQRGDAKSVIATVGDEVERLCRHLEDPTRIDVARLRLALGRAEWAESRVHMSLEIWLAALRDLPNEPPPRVVASLERRISAAYMVSGQGDEAVSHARRAVHAARDARDFVAEAESLRQLAIAHRDIGEYDEAEAQLTEAVIAVERVDRPRLGAELGALLSDVLLERGAVDEADAALAKTCRAFAALQDFSGLADALRRRGDIQLQRGIYTRAMAFAEESARQAAAARRIDLEIRAHLLGARAAAANGDSPAAHKELETAFNLITSDAPTRERADCLVVLGDLVEAGILTSDRRPSSLLREAEATYRAAGCANEAEALRRRLDTFSRATRPVPS